MSARAHIGGRDLVAATGVGVLLLALVAGVLWWRSDALVGVVLAVVIAAFVDVSRVLDGARKPVLSVLVMAALVIMPATFLYGAEGQIAGVLTLFGSAVVWLLTADVSLSRLAQTAATLLAGIWVLVPASFALLLVTTANGTAKLAFVIAVVALTDSAGYAIGVPFGRHKLSQRLSPNKTVEGLLGGVGASVIGAAIAWPLVFDGASRWQGVAFGLIVAIVAAVGDIAESGAKRALDAKDFGTLLPGHGGVLDRIDGLLFALPVATVLFAVL